MTAVSRSKPRILVFGRSGQLATELVASAARQGLPLQTVGRPDHDLADPAAPDRAIATWRPDVVINAAAYTNVDKAESEPELAFTINRDGPARLAAACGRARVPLVHVSTDMIFGDTRTRAHREDDVPEPLGAYARSKLAGEAAVAVAVDESLLVRVSWVYGPSGDNFVKKLLQWAKARTELSIVADQRGRPTYSPDLAAALLALAERMTVANAAARPRGLLHIAGADVLTRDAQARLVMTASAARGGASATIKPVATSDFPTPAKRPLNAVLAIDRAFDLYGIRLGIFQQDLERMLDIVLGPRLS